MANSIKADIAQKSAEILQKIRADSRLSHYVPTDKIPIVFMETSDVGKIRLIVIGQDPTVKKETSREMIETVLNLDKPRGSLHKYISLICEGLGLDLCQHVYATNYAKNFFIRPPTQIKECNLLGEFSQYWLPLLQEELSLFPGRPILTLGQPLLKALLADPKKALVRLYWGYTSDWARSQAVFSFVAAEENKLKRRLFPFPHQPSLRKRFYDAKFQSYLGYMKNNMTPS
jgi:uracil-DNA glycosylase